MRCNSRRSTPHRIPQQFHATINLHYYYAPTVGDFSRQWLMKMTSHARTRTAAYRMTFLLCDEKGPMGSAGGRCWTGDTTE